MRERLFISRGLTPSLLQGSYTDYGGQTFLYSPTGSYWPDCLVSGMVDVVSQNYHRKSREGEIVNNPMWSFIFNLKQTKMRVACEGQCRYYVKHKPELAIPSFWYPKSTSYAEQVDAICDAHSTESSIAQAAAWANIDVSEIQGLASLGELPETIKMLIDIFKLVIRLTVAAKRGDLSYITKYAKKAGFTIDGLSDIWLGYRYGIRPLIGDIQNLLAAVAKDLEKGLRLTYRGKHLVPLTTVTQQNLIAYPPPHQGMYLGVKYSRKLEHSASFRAGVLVQIDHTINSMTSVWGLDSPIEAVWELVPFSFIVDWIANVGDCIAAAILNPSLSPRASWVTEQISTTEICDATSAYDGKLGQCWNNAVPLYMADPPCRSVCVTTVKRRLPIAARYNLPSIRLNLDLSKIADLILIARKIL